MTKPTLNIWGANASVSPLTDEQQAQGYAYTASKTGQLAGTVETDDLDFPMKKATTAISWLLSMLSDNGGLSKNNAAIDISADGVFYVTKNLSSASSTVGGDGWTKVYLDDQVNTDMSGQRVSGQEYTNDTDKPIIVSISVTRTGNANIDITAIIDGTKTLRNYVPGTVNNGLQFTVFPGQKYTVNIFNGQSFTWDEYR